MANSEQARRIQEVIIIEQERERVTGKAKENRNGGWKKEQPRSRPLLGTLAPLFHVP
jgi:hypothetical protein